MNNWETKRIHLLGVIGIVLERRDFSEWAEKRFKNYVDQSLYAQWNETTVALDKQRAEAGLPEYQPGAVYQAERSYDTMAMASLFDAGFVLSDCGHIICQLVRPVFYAPECCPFHL